MASRQSKLQEDTYFRVMKVLEEYPEVTQRELAVKLGLSLGGINYCLSALIEKGFVKARNFSKNNSKNKYAYLLTPKGIKEKSVLTYSFLQRKMQEYEDLKREIDGLKLEVRVDKGGN
jgi:EPS-associated MarR family transcriptional regulator